MLMMMMMIKKFQKKTQKNITKKKPSSIIIIIWIWIECQALDLESENSFMNRKATVQWTQIQQQQQQWLLLQFFFFIISSLKRWTFFYFYFPEFAVRVFFFVFFEFYRCAQRVCLRVCMYGMIIGSEFYRIFLFSFHLIRFFLSIL